MGRKITPGRRITLLSVEQIDTFFAILSAQNPDPQGELEHVNAYTLLVAVVLSAQATDVGVNKATRPLFLEVRTPEEMIQLGEEKLKDYIKTIGLYHTKAKNIIRLSQRLIDECFSTVPADRATLETLPGVGRKTANVVMSIAFNVPTIAVDTHVFRVSNRTGLALASTPLHVEELLVQRVPEIYLYHAHHWLLLLGRYTCKARQPLCSICPVNTVCHFSDKDV